MDTETTPEQMAAFVAQQIDVIKHHMPETYKAIQERGKPDDLGRKVFDLVRRGIRGEPNCFYAVEAGHVVGTGFNMPEVTGPIAINILTMGCGFLIMLPDQRTARVLGEEKKVA